MTGQLFDIDDVIEGLKQQRDEIRLQIHLAKAGVREEWQEMEKKWEELTAKAAVIGRETGKSSREVFEAVKLVADEVRHGYERIRKRL